MRHVLIVALLAGCAFAQSQPDVPKIATPVYWSAVGVTAGLAFADGFTAQQGYQRALYCHEIESSWLYGRRPGAAREYATLSAEVVLTSFAAYQLKKHPKLHRFWFVPFLASAEQHTRGTIRNLNSCR